MSLCQSRNILKRANSEVVAHPSHTERLRARPEMPNRVGFQSPPKITHLCLLRRIVRRADSKVIALAQKRKQGATSHT